MNQTVSALSIAFMAFSCVLGFAIPVVLLLYFRLRKGADILPFFVGCAVMLLFALVLESIVHQIVLGSKPGKVILENTWLYALYGGFMAGLFEETGRRIAFQTVLKKYREKDINALMYGAGHGGFEAMVVLGITMINNIIWSVMINTGNAEAITGSLTGDALSQAEASIQQLIALPAWQPLFGGVERIFAVALQLALSVLVWFSVKKKGNGYLYPIAILIHCAVDAGAVILARSGVNMVLVEVLIGIATLFAVVYAKNTWKRLSATQS